MEQVLNNIPNFDVSTKQRYAGIFEQQWVTIDVVIFFWSTKEFHDIWNKKIKEWGIPHQDMLLIVDQCLKSMYYKYLLIYVLCFFIK